MCARVSGSTLTNACACRRSAALDIATVAQVSVLNPEDLKPVKKRKRKEYLSQSDEESEMESMVGRPVGSVGWRGERHKEDRPTTTSLLL